MHYISINWMPINLFMTASLRACARFYLLMHYITINWMPMNL